MRIAVRRFSAKRRRGDVVEMCGFVLGGVGLYGELLRTKMRERIEAVETLLTATSADEEKARLREEVLRLKAEYNKRLHGLKYCL